MIQDQIAVFTQSLKSLATEYSNPAIIMDHIPVLKNNPEMAGYGIVGMLGLFVLRKILKRSRKPAKPVSMVMPAPYVDPAQDLRAMAPDLHSTVAVPDRAEQLETDVTCIPAPKTEPQRRSAAQQIDDLRATSLVSRPAYSADEARMRAVIQAVLADLGAPHQVMARTALSALVTPAPDVSGAERAHACAAIADKYVDFGIFDRAGRLVLALDLREPRPILRQALEQAGIPSANLEAGTSPRDVRDAIAPYLKLSLRSKPAPTTAPHAQTTGARPARPIRSGRPLRPASAIAAE